MRFDLRIALPAACVVGALALPSSSSADTTGTCPDGFTPVPDSFVVNGTTKDKNNDGVVCAKLQPSGFTGGPDDNAPLNLPDEDVVDDVIS